MVSSRLFPPNPFHQFSCHVWTQLPLHAHTSVSSEPWFTFWCVISDWGPPWSSKALKVRTSTEDFVGHHSALTCLDRWLTTARFGGLKGWKWGWGLLATVRGVNNCLYQRPRPSSLCQLAGQLWWWRMTCRWWGDQPGGREGWGLTWGNGKVRPDWENL